MTPADIARLRLRNQQLVASAFTHPADLVAYLGAVQSQDYAAAKWALAQRLQGGTETVVEQAFNGGSLLRTHVLRPTWHFVAPADIRWMLALTAPRVHSVNAIGAMPIGAPGWPELAFWTPSIANVRMVLIHNSSKRLESLMQILNRLKNSLKVP